MFSTSRRQRRLRTGRYGMKSQSVLHHPPETLNLGGITNINVEIGSAAETLSNVVLEDHLGLTLLYEPETAPSVHIIFVHGLRGTSQRTWAKDQKPELFWPKAWLPREDGIHNARISTFGYDADFMARGPNRTWTITDFANDLLFELDFTLINPDLRIGKVPLLFIAHSMGGLVVKKACILGATAKQDEGINLPNTAVMFLSTPHYGSGLATWLQRILLGFGQSSKPYVSELTQNSSILRHINNQFLTLVPLPTIASFYETMRTSIGPVKMMILPKESAIFGHSDEIVKGLDADHHDVCKYTSTHDHNYLNVRDVLRRFVHQLQAKDSRRPDSIKARELHQIKNILDISESPDKDIESFYSYYMPGSCQGFISSHSFKTWVENPASTPHVLWVNGPPGAGKSVLSSCIVHHIKERGRACHFYYFRSGEETKRSIGPFLRSLAYQVANDVPEFRERLVYLAEPVEFRQEENWRDIWRRLFIHQFCQITLAEPIYWIFDGVDECYTPQLLLHTLASLLSSSGMPLRIMFLSRRSDLLSTSFKELSRATQITEINIEADWNDLSQYVREKLRSIQARSTLAGFTEEIERKILRSAKGNFLWTRLALERVLQCRSESDLEAALTELYPEIESVYRYIEEKLMNLLTAVELELSRITLTWLICSRRQLTFCELSEALQPEPQSWPNLLSSISQVCGGFVTINSHQSQVSVVHHSAEEYLTTTSRSLRIDLPRAHKPLLHKCLSILCKLTSNFPEQDMAVDSRFQNEPLLRYAASSWFYHLSKIDGVSGQQSLHILAAFLNGPCVLVWISIVASLGQLQPIVEAAHSLRCFHLQQQEYADSEGANELPRQQKMRAVDCWATDMIQITAKFGDHLLRHPRAIYSLVPAFCPLKSMIWKCKYTGLASAPLIKVAGVSLHDWDECLARFTVQKNSNVSNILCTDDYFAVSTTFFNGLTVDGCVFLYRIRTCEEVAMLRLGDAVFNMQFSASGHLLAISGNRHINIWTTPVHPSGIVQLIATLTIPDASRVLALTFTADDQNILTYSQDGSIQRAFFGGVTTEWEMVGVALGGTPRIKGPSCAAFNHDASILAVGFRGAPMAIWTLAPFRRFQQYERSLLWTGVSRIEWNHKSGHVIGVYDDGCVFKWMPLEVSEVFEFPAGAVTIKCNLKGNLFVTSSGDSTVIAWDFDLCNPVFQLSLPASSVDIAISPDGRSIYELRDSSCTIWQPIALIQRKENVDRTALSIYSLNISMDITALAVGRKTSACCIGNMDGRLEIINEDGRIFPFSPSYKAAIEHIAWSFDERYLATANFANQLLIRQIDLAAFNAEKICDADNGTILDEQLDAPVRQLLFNKASELVFVATQCFLYVWEIRKQPLLVSKSIVRKQYRWITHPGDDGLLLGFASDGLRALRWQDLNEEFDFELEVQPARFGDPEYPTSLAAPESPTDISLELRTSVDRVLTSPDGSLTFLQVGQPFGTRKAHGGFFLLHTIGIGRDASSQIRLVPLPLHLQALIQIPFGFVNTQFEATAHSQSSSADPHESRLAFLSNEGWICTMYLGGEDVNARVKSHYLLPRDWLVKDALELVEITSSGTLFCPRNGDVGMIRSGLGVEWSD